MCLADEDIPQRGRSRDKVEAARELEALCSGRSLHFDHSRCYEGWCVSGRGFPARLKGFLSAELINRWHHKSRCSEESHDDLWIRCCETRFATEAAVAMFTLSTVSSEASAEQDIFRHGCEGDLRQGFTVVLRGGHHRSTASPSTVRSGGLLSLTSTRFKVISPRLWRTFSGRARGGSSPWGITQENKVTKGSKEQDVKHREQESVGSPKSC